MFVRCISDQVFYTTPCLQKSIFKFITEGSLMISSMLVCRITRLRSADTSALGLFTFFTGLAKFNTTLYGISISMAFAIDKVDCAFFRKALNFALSIMR